jgi:hypothetical protein
VQAEEEKEKDKKMLKRSSLGFPETSLGLPSSSLERVS